MDSQQMDSIYADYNATTPVDPRVVEAMMPYLTDVFYNASSTHAAGMEAQRVVMQARMQVASHIGGRMNEVIFTSGATEAINLAILGMARHETSERRRIVTCRTEHAAVVDACTYLETRGWPVTWLGVDGDGRIDIDEVRNALGSDTLLLSVMAVNNETGVKQDLRELATLAHAAGAYFMTDATQAYGKMAIDVDDIGIDLMTFSGHKIYAPKGVGALYVRSRKECTCELEPLQYGGGQERGIRSGTLNVPGIVALAHAGAVAHECLASDAERIGALRDRFEAAIMRLHGVHVNGRHEHRNYGTSNVRFDGTDVDIMLMYMPHVAVSKGSACASAKPKPSHVLTAMGQTAEQAACTLRFSFGRFTTSDDIDRLVAAITHAHEKALAGVVPA